MNGTRRSEWCWWIFQVENCYRRFTLVAHAWCLLDSSDGITWCPPQPGFYDLKKRRWIAGGEINQHRGPSWERTGLMVRRERQQPVKSRVSPETD
jgi:hypothetical protein